MKLNNLIKLDGIGKKRVGRGIGSGKGKTSTRGTKGQNSRSGGGVRIGFEGGQMPLTQRVPKLKGFRRFSPPVQVVNLDDLNNFEGKVTKKDLLSKKIIRDENLPVKILGRGKIEKAITIEADSVSKKAAELIQKAGGKVNLPHKSTDLRGPQVNIASSK